MASTEITQALVGLTRQFVEGCRLEAGRGRKWAKTCVQRRYFNGGGAKGLVVVLEQAVGVPQTVLIGHSLDPTVGSCGTRQPEVQIKQVAHDKEFVD